MSEKLSDQVRVLSERDGIDRLLRDDLLTVAARIRAFEDAAADRESYNAAETEVEFREWYASWSGNLGLHPDPDHPDHHYDYRACWRAGDEPDVLGHWPSRYKRRDHPTYGAGADSTTSGTSRAPGSSESASPAPPTSEGDQ